MELTASARSIPAIVHESAAARGGQIVLRKKDHGIWKAESWAELEAHVRGVGGGLLAAGFGRGDAAAVLSETRPEAVYADLAIQGAGGASIMLHPDDEGSRAAHILRTTGCRFIFVEDEEQLDKILTIRDQCPALARIVIMDMKGLRDFNDTSCQSLASFIAAGDPSGWEPSLAAIAPEHPAVILFPAGAAAPAGRVLSHGEVARMIAEASGILELRAGDERLAVLRMADVTERIFGLYAALRAGAVSNYLESPETATENLQQLQPTVFGADGEAWERLHARITRAADAATSLQRSLYRWAVAAGSRGGAMAGLANLLVLRAVRRELGLARVRLAYVGETELGPELETWAGALGIAIRRLREN
jgi:long-chain acyl-CoA synthetase